MIFIILLEELKSSVASQLFVLANILFVSTSRERMTRNMGKPTTTSKSKSLKMGTSCLSSRTYGHRDIIY